MKSGKRERPHAGGAKGLEGVTCRYHGETYQVVFGPSYSVELPDGTFWSSGKPSIDLIEVGAEVPRRRGLTLDLPEVPLKSNQVLVCGGAEGVRSLEQAGVVRATGMFVKAPAYGTTVAVCDLLITPPGLEHVRPTRRGLSDEPLPASGVGELQAKAVKRQAEGEKQKPKGPGMK